MCRELIIGLGKGGGVKDELKPDTIAGRNTRHPQSLNNQNQKKMYQVQQPKKTSLKVRNAVQGETIEQKTARIVRLNEPITDGAPLIYTDRKDGVVEAYDVRTDRWEIAVEQVDAAAKGYIAKREQRHKPAEDTPGEGGGE